MNSYINAVIDIVMEEHELRLDRPENIPLKRRKFKRKRPNTALIIQFMERKRLKDLQNNADS